MQFVNATTVIDSIKDAKTKVLNTVVTEQSFRKPLQSMIDAEAALAKATLDAVEDLVSKFKLA